MLKSQFFKLLPIFFIFLGRRVLRGLSTKVSCLEGNHQCGFSSVSAELTPYSCEQKLLFPSQTATCHRPPQISCFFSGKITWWQSNSEWFELPEHENCLSLTLITQPWTREALNFTVCNTKKFLIKTSIGALKCLLKSVRDATTRLQYFPGGERCQSGICTCKSRCIISRKVTGFQTCSLGLQELFSILTCQLKSTFSQGCVGHSEGPRAGFRLTSACDGFSSGSRRVVHFCLRSCHLP